MMPSVPQMLIVLAIVVVIFGGKRIGGIFKGGTEGLLEFKKAMKEVEKMDEEDNA